MNKKRLIYLILFTIIVVIAWLLISSWKYDKKSSLNHYNQEDLSNVTARENANWDDPFLKEIEVEFMKQEDLDKMNLASSSIIRLQVLERDEKGNVTAYKKIYNDEDIIRYKLDYSGNNSEPIQTPATSTTSTEIQ